MIENETLKFLSGLKANNHKAWFDEHKSMYQAARTNFLQVVAELIEGISSFDPSVASSGLDPKKCIMRINRDIRFSKDKSPYKTNFFAFINREGKKSPFGGYYFSVAPDESFHGGGIYMPESSGLAKIRQEIDYHFTEWQELLSKPSFKKVYGTVKPSGQLSRPPRGYTKDNPAIAWIMYKGYYTQKMMPPSELHQKDLTKNILAGFRTLKPMIDFINRAIE